MKLLIVGFGNMGRAIGFSLIKSQMFDQVIAVDKYCEPNYSTDYTVLQSHKDIPANFKANIILLAIKPQDVSDNELKVYDEYRQRNAVIVSIIAGQSIKSLYGIFGKRAKIARAMPNICIGVNMSTSLVMYSKTCEIEDASLVDTIFKNTGLVIRVTKEKEFARYTPITSCAPAFFYSMCIALSNELATLGVNPKQCDDIARKLFIGSANMLNENKELSFTEMNNRIASKGGIKETCLATLGPSLKKNIRATIKNGIKKAYSLDKLCRKRK